MADTLPKANDDLLELNDLGKAPLAFQSLYHSFGKYVPKRLPPSWKVKRLKDVAWLNPEVLPEDMPEETEILYVDISNVDSSGNVLSPEPMTFGDAPSRARRIVRDGDTILSTVRTYLKAIAYMDEPVENLIVSTGFCVLRPKEGLDKRYLAWLLRSEPFVASVVAHSEGISYPAINPTELGALPIWLPPLHEQRRIADRLDTETARIDGLIQKKQLLTTLARQRWMARLADTLLGFDQASVARRETGLSWLPSLPEHWSLKPVKFSLYGIEQGWSPQCDARLAEDDEWAVLKVGCVNYGRFNPLEHKALPADLMPEEHWEVRPGDVIMSRANTRELLGSAVLVRDTRARLMLCDKLYRLKTKRSVLNDRYLVYWLQSPLVRYIWERDATGTSGSMQNIGRDSVKDLSTPLPPLEEQEAIADQLDRIKLESDLQLEMLSRSIDLLREQRTTVISDLVTHGMDSLF